MEFVTEVMPLSRALERAGLRETARHLTEIAAQPHVREVKPLSRVRHAEVCLRRWIRDEPGAHIELAIAELLVGALTVNANGAKSGIVKREFSVSHDVRPIVEVKRRISQ
jgi:hypothetical protein